MLDTMSSRFANRYESRFDDDPSADQVHRPEEKKGISWSQAIELITALVLCVPILSKLDENHPYLKIAVALLAVILLIWIGRSFFVFVLDALRHRGQDKTFILNNRSKLQDLRDRLERFTSSDGRALVSILRSNVSSNNAGIVKILGCDYFGQWIRCFDLRLRGPSDDIEEFLLRCREFTVIVASFNRDYVVRAHTELSLFSPRELHFIDQLEEFREEFNAFLRELENWAGNVNNYALHRFVQQETSWSFAATNYFERVKTFRPAPTVTSGP